MNEKESFWLGIDCGGTYLKAGLYNREEKEYAIERRALQTISPEAGYAERDVNVLWQVYAATVRQLLQHCQICGEQVCGVGISAQGKGLFLLDKYDKPLGNAILSSDRPAVAAGAHA